MNKNDSKETTLGSILNDYQDRAKETEEDGPVWMLNQNDIYDLFRKVMEEEANRIKHQSHTDD